jgi:hypothetical protein
MSTSLAYWVTPGCVIVSQLQVFVEGLAGGVALHPWPQSFPPWLVSLALQFSYSRAVTSSPAIAITLSACQRMLEFPTV